MSSEVYQQLSQYLSVLDTFKGSWKAKYETYSKLKTALNRRQQQVLDFIRVREKLLLKTGERKGTRYHVLNQ